MSTRDEGSRAAIHAADGVRPQGDGPGDGHRPDVRGVYRVSAARPEPVS